MTLTIRADLALLINDLPDEALPYFADGCIAALNLAKRDEARLQPETLDRLRHLGRTAFEVFGKTPNDDR